jgi:hypothetical protein
VEAVHPLRARERRGADCLYLGRVPDPFVDTTLEGAVNHGSDEKKLGFDQIWFSEKFENEQNAFNEKIEAGRQIEQAGE